MSNAILVYNKNNELLAVFSSLNIGDTQDTLINPDVHIVANGDSTLTFSILASSSKWQQVKHPENKWHCDNRVYTMISENNVQYQNNVVSVTLYEDWTLLSNEYIQAHNVDLDVEAMDVHTVKILPKTSDVYKLTIDGTEYDDSEVVDSRGVLLPRGSAGYALWAMLKHNRYNYDIGVCDVIVENFNPAIDYGTFNLESDKVSRLDNIRNIQSLWGGILVFDSLNKLVHLRDVTNLNSEFNAWRGFAVYQGHNMKEPPQIQVDNRLVTRAYPLGSGDIHIKEVNSGRLYIDNFSYTSEIYENYIYNQNIHYTGDLDLSGQRQLKFWAEQQLAKLCKPRETYLFSFFDRSSNQEFEHETYDICDVIRIFFKNENTNEWQMVEQRIIDLKYNPWLKTDISTVTSDLDLYMKEIYSLTYSDSSNEPLPDWNGTYNVGDFYVNLDDDLKGILGGNSRQTMIDIIDGQISLMTAFQGYVDDKFIQTNAEITILSTELGSQISIFTDFKQQTESSIEGLAGDIIENSASIDVVSQELGAQIILEASHYQETWRELTQLEASIVQTNASIDIIADDLKAGIHLGTTYEDNTIGYWTQAFIDITSSEEGGIIKIMGDRVIVDNLYPYRIISQYDPLDYLTIGSEAGLADLVWRRDDRSIFEVYDTVDGVEIKLQGDSVIRSGADKVIYPIGTWDFTDTTVIGIGGGTGGEAVFG